MMIKVLKKNKISNSLKIEICKLKKTFWSYSLRSHKEWFEKNVKKEFRKKNLSKKNLDRSLSLSRKANLPLILICKKKNINFYKKFTFKLLKKNNFKFMNHKFNSCSMIYAKKIDKYLISNKIHIYLN